MTCVFITLLLIMGVIFPSAAQNVTSCLVESLLAKQNSPLSETDIISMMHNMTAQLDLSNIPSEFTVDNQTSDITQPDDEGVDFKLEKILTILNSADQKRKIRYLLFTINNKNKYQVMPRSGGVTGTYWDAQGEIKVLIHGLTSTYWFSSMTNIWTQRIFDVKDAYLSTSQNERTVNVIVVDWTVLSTVPIMKYPDAVKGTRIAGEDLAEFLINLKHSGGFVSWKDVHLLGHSLGAHVAGVAGWKIQELNNWNEQVERITGLDPAGLCFDSSSGKLSDDPTGMLDKSDAIFVDIIHSNMGNVIYSMAGRYGSVAEVGHVDFYPNGGEIQPGCNFLEDRVRFCSHQRSVIYYALSISMKYAACPCASWNSYRSQNCSCSSENEEYFGEDCSAKARGKFYLDIM